MSAPPKVGIDGRGRLVAVNVYPWRESIKDLPGSRYAEAGRTAWSLPATPTLAASLLTILAGTGASISERVRSLAEEELSRVRTRAVAADEGAPIPKLPWHTWLRTDPWRHQKRGIAFLRDSSAAAIGAGMGPQPVTTPILTPRGWRQLGDLAPGDEVFGPAGTPVRVRAVRHYGDASLYRVALSDGTSTRCTGEHRWRLSTPGGRQNDRERVMATARIVSIGTHQVSGSRRNRRFALPIQPVLTFDTQDSDLPIPPYALGALLGDGYLIGDTTPTLTCPDVDVRARVTAEVVPLDIEGVEFTGVSGCPSVRLSRIGGRSAPRGVVNPLLAALRGMGLAVGGHHKFIPPGYLMATVRQRTELLQGLLDTDGYPTLVGKGDGGIEFSTVSTRLAGDVAFLARTLGCRVRTVERTTRCQTGEFRSYRVMLRVPVELSPFWCVRRVAAFRPLKSRVLRGIDSITPDGNGLVCCIELDVADPDSAVYLTDSTLIPTLNSGKSLMVVGAANALEVRKLLVVAPAKAAGVWPREFRLHSACEWHVENGNRRGRGGALRRLGLEERWRVMIETLTSCACGKPHAVVVGYEAMAKAPLARVDMLALGIEMVCYDEAHRLKKAGGGASLTAFSWVNQIPRRAVLSGTLLPQTPADVYGTYRAVDPGIFGTNETLFRAEWILMGKDRDGREFPRDVHKGKRAAFSAKFHSILYLPTVDLKLPPVINSVVPVDLEPAARKVYDSIRDTGIAEITEAVIEAGGNATPHGDERTVAPKNAGVELTRLAQITGGATIDDDGNVAVVSQAKRNALADVLEQVHCVKGGQDGRSRPEPVVVFCRFRPDLAAVREVAAKAGLRYREVSGSSKTGLDDDSKMHPDCDILGVQIASGGEAIDFTRAHVVVWYSIGWELWRFQQAQKRVTRPGQTRPTLNYYLVAEESIDGIIYKSLAKKENVIDIVVTAYLRDGAGAEPSTESLPMMPTDEDAEMVGAPVGVPDWLLGADEPTRPAVRDDTEALQLALSGFAGL